MESIATVATDRPERYLKQLCSHLGRKIQADYTETEGHLTFDMGRGVVSAGEGVLTMRAIADDAESLAIVEDIIGRHLEGFGQRDNLKVIWQFVPTL
ncbi:hypothetical protein SAMN05421505_113117 [Sinosporangium album]|uniref:DUF2218 domain-containing protein n=1 Tax=Sinosporangium album TaxID=504805 RepID=A0A1G8B3M1_9ACTN|nr:DUF2218 domain-containing protein [Sinosporangium album]SDH27819.1 hypothetical protein SAMN05421505_113117 [Sinosporangium album]